MTLKNATPNFIDFIANSHFLKDEEGIDTSQVFLKPYQKSNCPDSPSNFKFGSNLLGNALKMKLNNLILNEKKLFYEIFDRLISEEKRELTTRERELIQELAMHQAKMIVLENELKEQKHRNVELVEKNLNYGKQVHLLLEEREDFLKNKAYFEKKMRRLEHSNKTVAEKFDNVKKLMALEKNKIEDQAYEKAKKANILFSTEYKIEIIPPQTDLNQKIATKSPKSSKASPKNSANKNNPNLVKTQPHQKEKSKENQNKEKNIKNFEKNNVKTINIKKT